MQYSVVL